MSRLRLEHLWRLVILVHRFVFSCRHDLSASCRAASELALTGATVGCSLLMSLVFPLFRLRAFVSTSICPSPSGPGGLVAVFSPCAGGLSTGCSSCPVISSYEKSPSCGSRSPRSLMCSVTCSCAASSSSRNGRTWDRAHLTTEPR